MAVSFGMVGNALRWSTVGKWAVVVLLPQTIVVLHLSCPLVRYYGCSGGEIQNSHQLEVLNMI